MIDVSYDGTWMKRGRTSKFGMGIIIEVHTRYVIEFELLSKYCSLCAHKNSKLKEKMTQKQYDAWKIKQG